MTTSKTEIISYHKKREKYGGLGIGITTLKLDVSRATNSTSVTKLIKDRNAITSTYTYGQTNTVTSTTTGVIVKFGAA